MANDPIQQMEDMEARYRIEVPDPAPQPLAGKVQKTDQSASSVPDPQSVDPKNVQPGQRPNANPDQQTQFEEHDHNGLNSKPVSIRSLKDFFEVLPATPTHRPKNAWDQIKIVNNAGTRELWVYDYLAASWHKI